MCGCSLRRARIGEIFLRWAGTGPSACSRCGLTEGSVVHLAYKLRENEHPEFGGLELEIAGLFSAG